MSRRLYGLINFWAFVPWNPNNRLGGPPDHQPLAARTRGSKSVLHQLLAAGSCSHSHPIRHCHHSAFTSPRSNICSHRRVSSLQTVTSPILDDSGSPSPPPTPYANPALPLSSSRPDDPDLTLPRLSLSSQSLTSQSHSTTAPLTISLLPFCTAGAVAPFCIYACATARHGQHQRQARGVHGRR